MCCLFTAVSCHDDDDEPKQEPGEEIVTPDPVVEYYIMGTVTDAGKGLSNVDVKNWFWKQLRLTRMVSFL